MKPHEQRVVDEKSALDEKLTALVQFICESPLFESLSVREQFLLREQRDHMRGYSDVLAMRIAGFEKDTGQ